MAGVVQLVALGAQDKFLTENPTVSFFRQKYNKHTNFSMTQKRMVIQGTQAIGQSSVIRVDHTGDLLAGIRFVSTNDHASTNDSAVQTPALWQTDIESVELLIGDQVIDKHTSEFDVTLAPDLFAKNLAESELGGQISEFYPLRFSCFEHFSSALPIIALQYHDVRIRINWGTTFAAARTVEAYATWIHLDTIERTFFAENELHYIMTQVQKATASGGKGQDLMFNNPVKFIAMNNGGAGTFFANTNKMK